ncbi:transglycosylase domain-containing protein [Pontibacter ruber]|uniref:peptidoglycan glycosyltransferase n=1 Tax=Pontibacter ruber TaxID=1343895 RepID=A0ABW5CRH2_9BACT|nr:transglycosylase domain-containing protein [Pontibacter ruber]
MLLLLLGAAIAAVIHEARTSEWQARKISRYAATLTYQLDAGPSDAIVFPAQGPFDKRLGYVQLPQLLARVQSRGMEVVQQSKFSPALMAYTSRGLFAPYPEKTQAGLQITDYQGNPVYQFSYPGRVYASYDAVPSLIIQALLFIENRQLLAPDRPYMNPAIDWVRFSRAAMHQLAKSMGMQYPTIGGSTLATQIEKFRHSPEGITTSPRAKLQQMASASVRTYLAGPQTLATRQELVLSYINTLPLYGAPGYGEVHGLGDGLWVWFGSEFEQVNHLLSLPAATGDTLLAQGQALRQVLSLYIAQRRPSYFLSDRGRAELNALTGSYLRLLAANGQISPTLRDAGLAREVAFRNFSNNPVLAPSETDKGALMVRTHLSGMLGKSLYDLDRMDLAATTSLQHDLQEQVTSYLKRLNDPKYAQKVGLFGDKLLSPSRTKQVRYSFTLYERTPQGNLVRVQTDNTDQPFDLNEGSKLELGSTAKLRVLVTYLEVIAEIHERYAGKAAPVLRRALAEPQDNLTRWVLRYLLQAKDKSLPATLKAALERRYSANQNELFFTGGGMHTFRNYEYEVYDHSPTVHEAFLKSINLPFIRLTRDLVRYSIRQRVGNPASLLGNTHDPRRRQYLSRFADREGRMYLQRFWHKYKNKTDKERLHTLLRSMRLNPVRLATVHRFLYPETDSVSFEKMMRRRLPHVQKLTHKRIMELYHQLGPGAFNLSDQGYLSRVHPLELWLLDYTLHHPSATWADVIKDSQKTRQEVYAWLYRTRFKHARDSRIRTMLELDAFADIQQRWERLGYPFEQLVPSLATALGSSGDRPEALAELMGIVVNNGVRQRTLRIEGLHFAAQTPYETDLKWQPVAGEQVLAPEVAALVRETLQEVVDAGTARRIRGGMIGSDGKVLRMGGKTGTGDNRTVTLSTRGHRLASRAENRTATFVFYLGDRHFGTVTAFVPGRKAADFHFTSSLPVQVLRGMAPLLIPYLEQENDTPKVNVAKDSPAGMQYVAAERSKCLYCPPGIHNTPVAPKHVGAFGVGSGGFYNEKKYTLHTRVTLLSGKGEHSN